MRDKHLLVKLFETARGAGDPVALQPLNDDDGAAIVPHAEDVPPPPVPVAPRPPRRKAPAIPPDAVVRRNKIRDTYKRLAIMKPEWRPHSTCQ